jgi:hypothetical protein
MRFASNAILVLSLLLAGFLAGCGPSDHDLQQAKMNATFEGEQELARLRRDVPRWVPQWYANGLFVSAAATSEGNFLSGYKINASHHIGSTPLIIALIVLVVAAICVGAGVHEKTQDKDKAYGAAFFAFGFPILHWLVLWAIAGMCGMGVADWPGWLLTLSILLMPVEALAVVVVFGACAVAAESRQQAAQLAHTREQARISAEAERHAAAENAEAERRAAAARAVAEDRQRKLSKGI